MENDPVQMTDSEILKRATQYSGLKWREPPELTELQTDFRSRIHRSAPCWKTSGLGPDEILGPMSLVPEDRKDLQK